MYCVFILTQKHKSKYHCLPFFLATLFLIDTLTLVKHEGICVFLYYNLLMSRTLYLSSVIIYKFATTFGIFCIGSRYCLVTGREYLIQTKIRRYISSGSDEEVDILKEDIGCRRRVHRRSKYENNSIKSLDEVSYQYFPLPFLQEYF